MRITSLTTLALTTIVAACATDEVSVVDETEPGTVKEDDVRGSEGCPALPDISAFTGEAELFDNGTSVDLQFGGDNWTSRLQLFFQHDDAHTFAPDTYALTDTPSSNVCASAPDDTRCLASTIYADKTHQMLMGGRSGQIIIDVAGVADLGRVAGTITELNLEQLDETGTTYVEGCRMQLGPIPFDVDLSLFSGGELPD